MTTIPSQQNDLPLVTTREAFSVWSRVALLSFGGPAGQIAVMHRILVEEKKWISEARFLHALNYCMLLPGPEAQQLATYIGWLLRGYRGGLMAGGLFILPGFLSILALSVMYVLYREAFLLEVFFFGLKPAVMAIVFAALVKIASKALTTKAMYWTAGVSFVALAFFNVSFPWLIILAALTGLVGGKYFPNQFENHKIAANGGVPEEDLVSKGMHLRTAPSFAKSLRLLALFLFLWLTPIAALFFFLGGENVFTQIGIFFSKAAVVTFGGAYALLAYLAQQAVHHFHWLQPHEMMDGLGMAETTPGPLIQVTQFVGFMGAYGVYLQNATAGLNPLVAGVLASVLTTWVTYVPCFLWIFLGAPYIELLRNSKRLKHALSTITAAVVGVILNLALWFSVHVIFAKTEVVRNGPLQYTAPVWETVQIPQLVLAIVASVALFGFKWGMFKTMFATVALAIVYKLLL